MKALNIAKYFIHLAKKENAGDTFSNLKIQKLLYYAQAYCLQIYKKALFDDEIEAWQHGPVVANVYNEFKKYQKNSISFNELKGFNVKQIEDDENIAYLLTFIFKTYGSKGAWDLRDETHKEDPWKNAYKEKQKNIINKEDIAKYYNKRCEKEAKKLLEDTELDEIARKYGII